MQLRALCVPQYNQCYDHVQNSLFVRSSPQLLAIFPNKAVYFIAIYSLFRPVMGLCIDYDSLQKDPSVRSNSFTKFQVKKESFVGISIQCILVNNSGRFSPKVCDLLSPEFLTKITKRKMVLSCLACLKTIQNVIVFMYHISIIQTLVGAHQWYFQLLRL